MELLLMTAVCTASPGQEINRKEYVFIIQHRQAATPRYFGRQVTIVCMVESAFIRGK